MSFVHTVLAFLVALGVLIVVHEYGHYLVARLCGVKVLRFSVGFGRALFTRRSADGTEWVLAAVPFGGYVKMLDEREAPVAGSELARAFNRQTVWRRIAIVIAGPAFNFLFAIAVYTGLFVYGIPEARPVIGTPPPASAAARAGFAAGDVVLSIDGSPIDTWQALRWQVIQAALQGGRLQITRTNARGHLLDSVLDLSAYSGADADAGLLERVGLRLHRPPLDPVLGSVVAGSPAARAGLRAGDRITQAAGAPIADWTALVATVRVHPAQSLILVVEREGKSLRFAVVPDAVESAGARVGRIGAAP
ncbi:MAG: RIP metalloprotease RseP, partial [Proteobacteria bacterium]|nr:RIP metalloprotease RseP [Pseudomonadota bacterium]